MVLLFDRKPRRVIDKPRLEDDLFCLFIVEGNPQAPRSVKFTNSLTTRTEVLLARAWTRILIRASIGLTRRQMDILPKMIQHPRCPPVSHSLIIWHMFSAFDCYTR